MRRALGLAAVWLALAGALLVLVVPDGDERAWWFRAFAALVGVLALRGLTRWLDAQPRLLPPEPFRRPRPWFTRRRLAVLPTHPTEQVLRLAEFSAGDAHRGLRPLLQEIADERLRALHGITLADPHAEERFAPPTWELIRPDRPSPHDLRSRGLLPDAIDAALADMETL